MKKNSFLMRHFVWIFMLPLFMGGCDKNEAVPGYAKGIGIHYVDKEGNILYFDKDGSISYFDKVDYYSQNLSEEDFLKTCPMEILSFTDESGIPLEHKFSYKVGHLFRFGIIENEGQKREYNYIVKYKIPPISGGSVEELRVTLKETEYGIPDGWFNCQYNGKNIRIITTEELFPDIHNPQQVIDEEEHNRRLIEMLHNGDLLAHEVDGSILVIIPVDIAP